MGKTLPTRPSQELWSFRDGRVTPLRQVMFTICNCLEAKVVCAKYRALPKGRIYCTGRYLLIEILFIIVMTINKQIIVKKVRHNLEDGYGTKYTDIPAITPHSQGDLFSIFAA